MKPFRPIVVLAALMLVVALPASASAALTAKRIRVAGHTGFVRVVIDFTGGTLGFNEVDLAAGNIDAQGRARLEITKAGALTTAAAVNVGRTRVSVARVANGLRVRIGASRHRFKFLGYSVLHSPERLVIDLYRRASHAQLAAGGCLKILPTTTSTSGRVTVRGTVVTRIFENTFRVRLRRSDGAVVSAKTVTAATPTGPWTTQLRHSVATRQTGLVEAIVYSAKDGAVQCLYQRPVTLRP
jgi:hypothetical protein